MDAIHEAHLARILEAFRVDAAAKYRRGQAEHGGDLWEHPRLLDDAIEEAIDLVVYLYTERERRTARLMPLIYVAGPFRGDSAWAIEQNIRRAETLALDVWRLGAAAICPHANTRFFQNAAPDDVWLKGDLEMVRRCDALVLVEGWQHSAGARAEVEFAQKHFLPVFLGIDDLRRWLEAQGDIVEPAGAEASIGSERS